MMNLVYAGDQWQRTTAARDSRRQGRSYHLARRSSRADHFIEFSGPASGVAGDRGDDLAGVQRTKRSAVIGRTASSSSGRRSRAA